ncbi:hypothetical protein GCM10023189_57170 [Nibrella saemangeumensis]|uniref:Secretion system C-terminal sorting domain-containing protein n=1 Tax=Nibrella saemangeumensis TaxID=1084526 RepID=A0ABP8NMF8_9BACT
MERAKIPGPSLIKNVTIEGFDYGIRIASPNYSMVMEHITIKNSRLGGILNTDNVLSIRKLKTSGLGGPAVLSRSANSMITIVDSELEGSSDASALVNEEGYAFVRNVTVTGFASSLTNHGTTITGPIEEFVHGSTLKKWDDTPTKTLNLKKGAIPDAPEVPWDLPENWVNVCDFAGGYVPGVDAANPQDIGPAIRAAIAYMNQPGNEAKTTLYLKPGIYTIASPVTIYGNVRRYVGNYAAMFTTVELENQTTALFTIQSTNYPAVVLEGISLPLPLSWPGSVDRRKRFPLFENNSDKDMVIQNVMCHTGKIYKTGTATGRVFIEDVKGGNHSNVAPEPFKNSMPPEGTPQFEFRNQEVYARQLNPEQIETKVLVDGGSLYVLGLKTEKFGTLVKAINGAEVEILGGQSIAADNVPADMPAFEVINAKANFIFSEQVSTTAFTNQQYFKRLVTETRGDVTRYLERDETPKRLISAGTPVSVLNLYIARPLDAQTITFTQLADVVYQSNPPQSFALTATATSGLPVSIELVSGPATLSDGLLTITGIGPITLKASQAGNQEYAPAADVIQTFTVTTTDKDKGVKPILECIVDNGGDQWTARFGYKNDMDMPVYIPAGPANYLTPAGTSQVVQFQPQRVQNAFTVSFPAGGQVSWSVAGPDGKLRTATATTKSVTCAAGARLSVSEAADNQVFRLYPNPSEGKLTVEWNRDEQLEPTAKLLIHTILGQTVLDRKVAGNRQELELRELPAGVYFLQINTSRRSLRKQFIIK